MTAAFIMKIVVIANAYRNIFETSMDVLNSRDAILEQASKAPEVVMVKAENGTRSVPVLLPKKQGLISAVVSEEDYDKVIGTSTKWRRSSSGYPISVKREGNKFVTTYMHKLVYGGPAKHVNGDRLNNTRENLVTSTKKRKREINVNIDTTVEIPSTA